MKGGNMKNIKRLFVSAAAMAVFSANAFAISIYNEFKDRLQEQYMKPFARDIGGLLGAQDFHSGRVVGFPGIAGRVSFAAQLKPSPDNEILNRAGVDIFGLPMAQAVLGLPKNFNVAVRGIPWQGATLIGGGIQWGLAKHTIAKFLPDMMMSAYYDSLDHDYLKLRHFSGDLSFSFGLAAVEPFAGVGFDNTKLETKVPSIAGIPVEAGSSVTTTELRYTAGLNLIPMPTMRLFGAYTLTHGDSIIVLGFGIKIR